MRFLNIIILILFFSNTVEANTQCLPVIEEQENASTYNYLIVPGVFNEVLTYYMTRYKKHLATLDVVSSQIKKINNYTVSTPEESAVYLEKEISSFRDGSKKVIIFSHSKGALEILHTLFKYPKIKERIHKVVLIQGPLQGVSSYDLTYREAGAKVAEQSWSFRFYRFVAKSSYIYKRFDNFNKEKVIDKFNFETLKKEQLLDKLIFVRTYKKVAEMNWKMRYLGGLYKNYLKEKSDGVVLWKEQLPEGISSENACVLDLYADHGDFVKASMFFKKKKVKQIKTFIDYILFNKEKPSTTL